MDACVHVYLLLLWFVWKPEKDVRSLGTAFMNNYKPLYESSARTKKHSKYLRYISSPIICFLKKRGKSYLNMVLDL